MHRLVTGAKEGECVDHINGDTLDNRLCNLRICTHGENLRNRRRTYSRSGYKGISWDKRKGSWVARVVVGGKKHNCGQSSDPIKAAKKYDAAARRLHGEFASLNFTCACGVVELCDVCGAPPTWKRVDD